MAHPKKAVIFKVTDSDREWLKAEAVMVAQQQGKKCTISEILRLALGDYQLKQSRRRKARKA